MKYCLVLGIEYKFFKRPADITIYIGNKFIDTFRLARDFPAFDIRPHIESKWYEKFGKSNWLTCTGRANSWRQMPRLFKVYEMDDGALEGRLEIKVQNANSDFTNGFMKNSSMIKFPIVSLFKKDLMENRGEKTMKAIVKFGDAIEKYLKRKGRDSDETLESLPGFFRSRWPNARSFWVSKENENYEKSGIRLSDEWVGGSFTAEFMIKKKYHMKILTPAGSRKELGFLFNHGHPKELVVATCKQLLNIYNEDQ
jgi:hypothetical protein